MPDPTIELTNEPDPERALRRAWPLIRVHRWRLAAAVVASVIASALVLALPVFTGRAVDAIDAGDRDALRNTAIGLGLAIVALWFGEQFRARIQAATGERVLETLRNRVTGSLFHQPLRFFDRHEAGQLTARATTDVQALTGFVRNGGPTIVNAAIFLVVSVAVLSSLSWRLTIALFIYLPFLIVTVHRFRRVAAAAYRARAESIAEMTAILSESMAARPTLAGIGADATILDRAEGAEDRLLVRAVAALRADNRLSPLDFGKLASLAAVLWIGGTLAADADVTVGVVASFAIAARQMFEPMDALVRQYGSAEEARSHIARLLELHTEAPDPAPTHHGTDTTAAGDGLAVSARRVTFGYVDDLDVVIDVSLEIPAGQSVALVGQTGSGKSTLATLLAGLRPADDGTVEIGGVDVEHWHRTALRRRVCLLPQSAHLIAGTVADNLRFLPGRHNDDRLAAALDRVVGGRVVGDRRLTLDAPVVPNGANLSAGERQLLALVRAELADPDLLVLDEATADVDPETEAAVAAALDSLLAGRTVLVIAHRPETAARCDRVIRMDGGRIVEDHLTR